MTKRKLSRSSNQFLSQLVIAHQTTTTSPALTCTSQLGQCQQPGSTSNGLARTSSTHAVMRVPPGSSCTTQAQPLLCHITFKAVQRNTRSRTSVSTLPSQCNRLRLAWCSQLFHRHSPARPPTPPIGTSEPSPASLMRSSVPICPSVCWTMRTFALHTQR